MYNDNDSIWGSLFSWMLLGGAYYWGNKKGHEKASFQYDAKLQNSEIENLKLQIAEMKREINQTKKVEYNIDKVI